jgi:hypothetical protein
MTPGINYLPFLPPLAWARALAAMLFVLDDERPSRSALDAFLATFELVTLLLLRLGMRPTSFLPASAHARLPRPLRFSARNRQALTFGCADGEQGLAGPTTCRAV